MPLGRAQQAVGRPVSLQAPKMFYSGEMGVSLKYLKDGHNVKAHMTQLSAWTCTCVALLVKLCFMVRGTHNLQ